ncbi:hypothetical protein GCM10007880_66460 [Mesorhizobium amorphae]|uniref:hypothetical protein n=1 Tax=Mesorhizobium amorphae TaxID=71433 RepID=UPI00235CF471|nr:hypothetical protein [Mesorhizobium amorphae]GLR46128.1 hypothetical protein GCM10007880_66460 [Mesorhizobium amorphae]
MTGARTIDFKGKTYVVNGKGQVKHNGGRHNVYEIHCGAERFENIMMPTGRAIIEHLRRIGGPKPLRERPPSTPSTSLSPAKPNEAMLREIAAPILTDYPAAKRSDPFFSRHFANTLTGVASLMSGGFTGTATEAILEAHRIAKITPGQYHTMAAWKQAAIERIVRKLIDVHFPAQAQTPRGRPPKNSVAMSNAERQDALQKRRRQAGEKVKGLRTAIEEIEKATRWLGQIASSQDEPSKRDVSLIHHRLNSACEALKKQASAD